MAYVTTSFLGEVKQLTLGRCLQQFCRWTPVFVCDGAMGDWLQLVLVDSRKFRARNVIGGRRETQHSFLLYFTLKDFVRSSCALHFADQSALTFKPEHTACNLCGWCEM